MTRSLPLALKVTGWLLLNLLLLAAIGAALVTGPGTWERFLAGPAGDRLQTLAVALTDRLDAGADVDDLAASLSREYGLQLVVVDHTHRILAGPALQLPAAVLEQLRPPAEVGPPPRDDDPTGRPRRAGRPPRERGRRDPLDLGRGRFFLHTESPDAWWMAARGGFRDPDTNLPVPVTLLATAPSRWAFFSLVNLTPWILGGATALVLSILLWLPPVVLLTRDVRRMTAATEHIAEGRFDTRVATRRSDEFGRLGLAINRMAARLEEHAHGQKRFLSDVAHELCSPLARLRVAVEILESRADPSLATAVSDVQIEATEIATLVNELLAFSKAGLRRRDLPLAIVDLPALARRTAERESAGPRLQLDLPENLSVRADPDLLSRALGNLIRNALRHAGPGAAVTLRLLSQDSGYVTLAVDDDGPGVPADLVHRLGEPFFRPDAARSREAGGTGLGLAIVRSCVAACQGTVQFSNRQPRGFRAALTLPRPEITHA